MKTRAFHLIFSLSIAAAAAHASETLSVIPDSAQGLGIVGGAICQSERRFCGADITG